MRWATPSGMGGHSLVAAREAEKRPSGAGVAMLLLLLLSCFSRVRLRATHRQQCTRLPRPWDSPGKNTGVGCHFLLQCIKVKSQSEVTQSCPTLSNPIDCSLPGSSVHGIFQERVLEWGAIAFSGRSGCIFPKVCPAHSCWGFFLPDTKHRGRKEGSLSVPTDLPELYSPLARCQHSTDDHLLCPGLGENDTVTTLTHKDSPEGISSEGCGAPSVT